MKNKNELNYKDLKMTCNPDIFRFDTTEELESQKIYPYDTDEESNTLFPFLSGINKNNPYGY